MGLKDTSSRPPKDLGEPQRRTSKTTLRSYDSRASGDQECPYRQARGNDESNGYNLKGCVHLLLATTSHHLGAALSFQSQIPCAAISVASAFM